MKLDCERVRAAAIAFSVHFCITVLIALLAAFLVFGVWFPYPYRDLAGGLHLFWLLIVVDIVCGPALTAFLFNPKKSKKELVFDLSIISVLQISALIYGLYSIALARPVILAFETDRFVAVSEADIDVITLSQTSGEFQKLSWVGPLLVGTRMPIAGRETLESIDMSIRGVEPSARPNWWQSYELSRPLVERRMKSLLSLHANVKNGDKDVIAATAKKIGFSLDALSYLPLVSKRNLDQWIVLLDSKANIVGYAPVDGFQ